MRSQKSRTFRTDTGSAARKAREPAFAYPEISETDTDSAARIAREPATPEDSKTDTDPAATGAHGSAYIQDAAARVAEGHSIRAWISSGIGKYVVTFRMGPEAASWACGNKQN